MNKKAFIFLYSDMDLGGIQKYIYNYIVYFNKNGVDTYWLAPQKFNVDTGFKKELSKVNVVCGKLDAKTYKRLSEYDEAAAVTFSVLQFETLKKMVGDIPGIRLLYIVPHFKNPEIHPEEFFSSKRFRNAVKKWIAEFYADYLNDNNLYFINEKHAAAISNHYGLPAESAGKHLCKKVREIAEYDENAISRKMCGDDFNIITVSRFEFPHKGYVLGLLDIFPDIVKECPEARLTIIGYGDGENDVSGKIRSMPGEIADRITVVGRVSFTELQKYYNNAHLSIGLAGSAGDAAMFGVPVLVARHYCEKCEVYGQFAENYNKRLSEEPGGDPIPYIKQVYDMESGDYISLCRRTYEAEKQILNSGFDPFWVFKVKQGGIASHSGIKIGLVHFRAVLWVWTYRFKMMFKSPKVFIEKVKSRLK